MRHIEYREIDEKGLSEDFDNGLEVFTIQKSGYNKKFVTYFKILFNDNHFRVDGKNIRSRLALHIF